MESREGISVGKERRGRALPVLPRYQPSGTRPPNWGALSHFAPVRWPLVEGLVDRLIDDGRITSSASAVARRVGCTSCCRWGRHRETNGAWGGGASQSRDTISGMSWGSVELEPEVRDWLEALSDAHFGHAAFYIDLLAERGVLLSEPHTKQLDGKLRELRFDLSRQAIRITYWIAPGRRIILLTVFTKTKDRDRAQVARAKKAMLACIEAKHIVDEEQ